MRADHRQRIAALLLGASLAAPLLLLAALSAARGWEFPALRPRGWSLDAWRDTLTGGAALGRSLLLSVGLSCGVALVSTLCGALAGRFVAARTRPDRLRTIALLPFTASPIVLGVCLLWVFLKLGLTETILGVGLAQLALARRAELRLPPNAIVVRRPPPEVVASTPLWTDDHSDLLRAMRPLSLHRVGNGRRAASASAGFDGGALRR